MLNLGMGELVVVVVLAIVVVGPERLPEVIRWLGRQYGRLLRASNELRRAFLLEADRIEAEARAQELKKRRMEAARQAEEARARAGEDPARVTGVSRDGVPAIDRTGSVPTSASDEEAPALPRLAHSEEGSA